MLDQYVKYYRSLKVFQKLQEFQPSPASCNFVNIYIAILYTNM